VSTLHTNTPCLKIVVVCAIDGTWEWKRFT
jgi:hypothetical protein